MKALLLRIIFFHLILSSTSVFATIKGFMGAPALTSKHLVVHGWACKERSNRKLKVLIYIGEKYFTQGFTTEVSSSAVSNICKTSNHIPHGFKVYIPKSINKHLEYKNIKVIAQLDSERKTLSKSNTFQVPYLSNAPALNKKVSSRNSPSSCPVGSDYGEDGQGRLICKLNRNQVLNGRLNLIGSKFSNLSIDCNGGELRGGLVISSQKNHLKNTYSVPENILIKNCRISAITTIKGMGNANHSDVKASAKRGRSHVGNVRSNAPSNIVLFNNRFTPSNNTAIFVSAGVSYVTIENNRFTGKTNGSVVIYLEAESFRNKILNNNFNTDTTKVDSYGPIKIDKSREIIAVDASTYNIIKGNYFNKLDEGGIYLYRNCGESGSPRYTFPSFNLIEGNEFYYNRYNGSKAGIHLGSRQGDRSYCGDDYVRNAAGSASNNLDQAVHNTVKNNVFYNRYKVKNSDFRNTIIGNRRVSK